VVDGHNFRDPPFDSVTKGCSARAVIPAYDMRLLWISVNMHLSGRSLALTV
jgi:hypothetical protein